MNSVPPGDPNKFQSAHDLDETRAETPDDARSDTPHGQAERTTREDDDISPFKKNDKLGRYVIIKELGVGGFGHVYLAQDPKLNRRVAIKYPRLDRANIQKAIFLEEGRSVARLDHPSIVKIFNIEETDNGDPFVVMEYIEGPTLRNVIRQQGLSFSISLSYLIQIAEALVYAHSQTLIHRDLKPANVIITQDGLHAKLMDFGMALHDLTPEERLPTSTEGTPPYMSPEQVRGENHRLDGRTDIWAFGVLAYVMLTGRKPFSAKQVSNLVNQICLDEPKLPRRINPSVPEELERICLKCLEKLMSARYQTSKVLLDDLKSFQLTWRVHAGSDPTISSNGIVAASISKSNLSASEINSARSETGETNINQTQVVKVVPKGLRSFDSQDAAFFVDLLPGPKDRNGIPESLRFWLSKISKNAQDPISVGLIFGPSGCGKSSFIKAGLIPRLDEVTTVYVEASPGETEKRILDKLSRAAPQVGNEDDLTRVFARIRRGQSLKGEKMLIVIDQFEQWLHSNPELNNQTLIQALRQCDGTTLSCILLVRDDFWMSATQFMSHLDLKVQEGVNALGMPLFTKKHARRVLKAYGQANEAFDGDLTPEQIKFVSEAVSEMSHNGRVIPIHLALFSQMMDSDSWDADQLKKMGGWKGLGVHFLESIFSNKRAANYEATCRVILQQLLPGVGSKIKGAKKSSRQIRESLPGHSAEKIQGAFDLLDRESRIITPTESDADDQQAQHYQLAHDFLVEPIRQWLTNKEQQTRQGRARLRLAELESQWQAKKETRFLPSLLEYASIRTSVDKSICSPGQKQYLKTAGRHYTIRLAMLGLFLGAAGLIAMSYWNAANTQLAKEKYDSLLIASPEEVGARLELLEPFDPKDLLKFSSEVKNEPNGRARLHALLVKSRFGELPKLPLENLVAEIPEAESIECKNIVNALRPLVGTPRQNELWQTLQSQFEETDSALKRFRLSVVALQLGSTEYAKQLLSYQLDPEVREHFIESFPNWHGELNDLIELLKESNEPSLTTGLCLSLGQIPENKFDSNSFSVFTGLLNHLIKNAQRPEVHSTARWALERFGAIQKLDRLRSPDSSWFVKYFGKDEQMTFVRIEPHTVYRGYGLDPQWRKMFRNEPKEVELKHSFHISAREVQASLFYEYIAELGKDDPVRSHYEALPLKALENEDLPIASVRWSEAAKFCNWLSEKENLRPCYVESKMEIKGSDESAKKAIEWETDASANGYRLPTSFEWEAAHRGGTNTKYFFGSELRRLRRYAITGVETFMSGEITVAGRGLKMPNRFGLFDTNGNASEWCSDNPEFINFADMRYMRGGYSNSDAKYFQAASFFYSDVNDLATTNPGFRLVIQID